MQKFRRKTNKIVATIPFATGKWRRFLFALALGCACTISNTHAFAQAAQTTTPDPQTQHALFCAKQKTPGNPKINADPGNLPVKISSDSLEALLQTELIMLDGDVLMQQGAQTLSADHATYQMQSGDVQAKGNVFFQQNGIQIHAEQIHYNLQDRTGQAQQADYQITDIPARGQARQIKLLDPEHSHYTNITYTTCPPGDSSWELSAEEIDIDRAEGVGTAYNATLSFMHVPIAYSPWMTFPIDDRRRSGFLPPSIGYDETEGFDLTLPYYLNLAPNYDLTLLPRNISERGPLLGAELRFLTTHTSGTLHAEYMPKDKLQETYNEERGSFTLQTRSRFSSKLNGNIHIEHVSDDEYLDDLSQQPSASTTALLQRNAELRYQDTGWNLLARLKNYQVLNNGSEPYSILPQVKLDLQMPGGESGLTYHLDSEIIHFSKNDDSLEATRLDIHPSISLPLQEDYYHLTPKIGARYTRYALDNRTDGLDDSPDRLAGIFSLDSGLYFERDTFYFGSAAQQTLEPRIFYLYTTRHNQDDIPLFDTSLHAFSTSSLLRESRFNGADRVGDANQISFSLTTRYNDSKTGREKLKASLGQIFYLQDREVTLSGNQVAQDSRSDIAGDFTAYLSDNWRTNGSLIWDTQEDKIDQALAQVNYRADNSHLFNLTYRLRDDVSQQIDVSGIWPLTDRIKALGYWRYSPEENQSQEAVAGFEYGECCWRIRFIAHQEWDMPANDPEDLAFLVQFELTGLGKLGNDLGHLLTRSIYGYRTED